MKHITKMVIKITAMMVVMLMLNTCVFAQYYKDDATGISLVMSDNWSYINSEGLSNYPGGTIRYTYKYGPTEIVEITMGDLSESLGNDDTYNIENLSDDLLYSLCEDSISNEAISGYLTASMNIKSESELTSRETINGIEYFRVEKAFTGTRSGYYPFYGYMSIYETIHNGMMVVVVYLRPNDGNHFTDVYAMMQTLSFPQNNAAFALPSSNVLAAGGISIVMNGEYIYPDSAPIMQNDRVLVPIRAVAEKMGYTVEWDDDGVTQVVNMRNSIGTNEVMMIIDNPYYFCNDDMKRMDVAPAVIGDYTYIPLRAAAEAFGANVSWDDPTQTVYISY